MTKTYKFAARIRKSGNSYVVTISDAVMKMIWAEEKRDPNGLFANVEVKL